MFSFLVPMEFKVILWLRQINSLSHVSRLHYICNLDFNNKMPKCCKSTATKIRLREKGNEKCLILIIYCMRISSIKCIYLTDSDSEVLYYSGWRNWVLDTNAKS